MADGACSQFFPLIVSQNEKSKHSTKSIRKFVDTTVTLRIRLTNLLAHGLLICLNNKLDAVWLYAVDGEYVIHLYTINTAQLSLPAYFLIILWTSKVFITFKKNIYSQQQQSCLWRIERCDRVCLFASFVFNALFYLLSARRLRFGVCAFGRSFVRLFMQCCERSHQHRQHTN